MPQVYLAAITGHVPDGIVRTFSAFMEFCYLVRRDTINEDTLAAVDEALRRFHQERTIFEEDVRTEGISLPRQHSLKHYRRLIQLFGAPNGLCSSITESRHIKAVKEPYRRSSKHNALGQMLLTNQRLDKLAAARVDFMSRGMLDGPLPGLVARLRSNLALSSDDLSMASGTRPIEHRAATVAERRPVDEDVDDDEEVVEGARIDAEVKLAKTPCEYMVLSLCSTRLSISS